MFMKRLWVPHIGPALAATMLFFHLSAAHAVAFDSDISITGSTTFDTTKSFGGSGDFNLVSGGVTDDDFLIAFDTVMNVTNNSTDIFWVTINLAYDKLVNADGADAYADSELVLQENGTEIFFSDLKSDTSFGDEIGAALTGGFGDELTDSGTFVKVFELNPADVLTLDLIWTLEGGDYDAGLAEGDLSAFLSVASVDKMMVPVPAPLHCH